MMYCCRLTIGFIYAAINDLVCVCKKDNRIENRSLFNATYTTHTNSEYVHIHEDYIDAMSSDAICMTCGDRLHCGRYRYYIRSEEPKG